MPSKELTPWDKWNILNTDLVQLAKERDHLQTLIDKANVVIKHMKSGTEKEQAEKERDHLVKLVAQSNQAITQKEADLEYLRKELSPYL